MALLILVGLHAVMAAVIWLRPEVARQWRMSFGDGFISLFGSAAWLWLCHGVYQEGSSSVVATSNAKLWGAQVFLGVVGIGILILLVDGLVHPFDVAVISRRLGAVHKWALIVPGLLVETSIAFVVRSLFRKWQELR